MNTADINSKVGKSLKWSSYGELLAKLIAPISNMILARILVPEDFGVVATVNMIITFVDLFTDSGFAKYIVQADFKDTKEFSEYTNIAFWTNLVLSIFLWIMIFVFRYPIALLVGSSGKEMVIVLASLQIIVTAFSSVQTAIYRREFNFKTLFIARTLTAVIPLLITVPLAILLKSYWALVIGSMSLQLINAMYLMIKSKWKPKLYYNFAQLKEMFSYSSWSLAEALSYWMMTWFDVFIIGSSFSSYYVGIYKNSLNMVNTVMQLVKASIIPVLFSTLSRLKDNNTEFSKMYLKMMAGAGTLLLPLGVGLFVFCDTATLILFGEGWEEASLIVGSWALSACLNSLFVNFYGEALKAKGYPKILFFYELLCLFIMIPICYISKKIGFWQMVYVRSALVIVQIILGFFVMKKNVGIGADQMLKDNCPAFGCALIMGCFGWFIKQINGSLLWQLLSIVCCVVVYFGSYYLLFKDNLSEISRLLKIK